MKTSCLLVISLSVSGLLFAEEGRGDSPGKRPGRGAGEKERRFPAPEEVWKRADTSGDGQISLEEFALMDRPGKLPADGRERIFNHLDKDGDGFIQRSEWPMPGKSKEGRRGPAPRLSEHDADGSGGVSFGEFQRIPWVKRMGVDRQREIFARLDTDGSGEITPADRPKGRGKGEPGRRDPKGGEGRMEPGRIMEALDTDRSGTLDFEEFRESPRVKDLGEDAQEDRFEEMDKNGDLKLDRKELGGGRGPEAKGGKDERPKRPKRPGGPKS